MHVRESGPALRRVVEILVGLGKARASFRGCSSEAFVGNLGIWPAG